MKIPLKNGEMWDVDPFIDGFKAKHPHIIDMQAELAKMHLWLARNPARQPSSPFRFVDNWLAKIKPQKAKMHLVGKMTESEIDALGRQLGIPSRPGENYSQYLRRLQNSMEKSA